MYTLFSCPNIAAKSNRKIQISKLSKERRRIQTAPLITNHIVRALHQFHNNYPVSIANTATTTDEIEKTHLESINAQLSLGIDNLLSGALTTHLSSIQHHHIKTYNVGKFTSLRPWNRSAITSLLNHANELWQFRSKALHDEALLTREALLMEQSIALLSLYKAIPYKIAYEQRHLLDRTTTYFRQTHLRNVRSWLNRFNLAIEEVANRAKNGRTDIRHWLQNDGNEGVTTCLPTVDHVEQVLESSIKHVEQVSDPSIDIVEPVPEPNIIPRNDPLTLNPLQLTEVQL